MKVVVVFAVAAVLVAGGSATSDAQDEHGREFAENAMQAYLAMWSRDQDVNAESVARFYAPHVVYYGKPMTRAQVLADKRAFIKHWPVRHYAQAPGTFSGRCDSNRTRCTVSAIMTWQRVDNANRTSKGRARINLEFVPVDGTRKIARESAQML